MPNAKPNYGSTKPIKRAQPSDWGLQPNTPAPTPEPATPELDYSKGLPSPQDAATDYANRQNRKNARRIERQNR
jgi:hypothetical protein